MGIARPLTAAAAAVAAFLALLPAPAAAAGTGGGALQSTGCRYRSPACRWPTR
ncbi:hypothetical protein [Dactylosporangium matsuzakiense]|uniref:hypothetical protein n=1 Tax=Dactylosporangium matsuzakiense TaxID=53360 RepID=UPI0021C3F20C|nr:hypothetical protein [Dactylosporangium matsuzakiense]UWZ47864.1 hypothetical protein Dmats_16545 [Dactylosporangium matsuzakiense]